MPTCTVGLLLLDRHSQHPRDAMFFENQAAGSGNGVGIPANEKRYKQGFH